VLVGAGGAEAEEVKLYIYLALGLALLGAGLYVRHLAVKAGERDAAVEAYEALQESMATLKEAHAREIKNAQEQSNGYQSSLRRLESERARVPVVRLCRSASPAVPAIGSAPSGSHAASAPDDGGSASPDIGAALIDYGIACEANMLQLDRLRAWVAGR
jgi:hypothetical protein